MPTFPAATTRLRFKAYLQLTRLHLFPLGSIVICWPGVLGLALAAHQFPIPTRELLVKIAVFCLGGTLFHSAFCVYNDICDRDIDGRVARTKSRPLISGEVTALEAWFVFVLVYAAGFFAMTFAGLNRTAAIFGVLSMPLHFLYPLAKRWTWLPQGWLGISNGWSFFVGWFALAGKNSSREEIKACLAMYTAMACWTTYFDTIYASQDRKDDARAGIRSTALLFGDRLRSITSCLAALTTILLIATGALNKHGPLYFLISCGGVAAHFSWQMLTWDVHDRERCGKLFKSNGDLGWILFSGVMADTVFHSRPRVIAFP